MLTQPQEFLFLYPNDKAPCQSLSEKVDLANTSGCVLRDSESRKFLYFESHRDVVVYFGQQDRPYLHSVINKNKPVRLNLELDITPELLENIVFPPDIIKKIEADGQDLQLIKSLKCFEHVKNVIGDVLDEHYGIESSDYVQITADDNRKSIKYSYRVYMKLAFANIREYRYFISLVQAEVKKEVLPMIDPTTLMLRTPGSYKDGHVCTWRTPECTIEDALLDYTDNCDVLKAIAPQEEKDMVVDPLTDDTTKRAVGMLSAHKDIMGNFYYTETKNGFLQFKRTQPSDCGVCERVHDNIDGYATIHRGHVYWRCFRTPKKFVYIGFLGVPEVLKFRWADLKNMMLRYEKSKTLGLTNKERSAMANDQQKMYDEVKKSSLKNSLELTQKLLTQNRPFYYHDSKYIHGKTFANNDVIMEYIRATQFKILNGGDTSYITKSKWKGRINYTILNNVPFRVEADMVMYSIPNPDFKPDEVIDVKKNPITIRKNLGNEVMEYLRVNNYQAIDFQPFLKPDGNKMDDDIFNLFQGFKLDYEKVEYKYDEDGIAIPTPKIKKWIDHVINVICSGNKATAKKVLQWFAHIIQKPDEKAFAMIWRSEQGAGKSIFYDLFSKTIGDYLTLQLSKMETLTEKHNKILEGRLLVNPNECSNYPTMKDMNVLKSFITEVALNINPKNRPCYTIDNWARLLITTNDKFSARLSYDDRRWLCLEVSSSTIGKKAYFKPLVDSLNCRETHKELFNYLANYDISDFHCQRPPMTAYKKSMIADQLKDTIRYVQDLAENATDLEWEANVNTLTFNAKILHKQYYGEWCKDNGYRLLNKTSFSTELSDIFGIKCTQKRHDGKQVYTYTFDRTLLLPVFRKVYNNEEYAFNVCDTLD
jgi:hypothetical protein